MDYPAFKNFMLEKLRNDMPASMFFHGYRHTMNMLQAAEQLIIMEGVKGEKACMVKTAVLLLDAPYLDSGKQPAEEAVRLAHKWLPDFGYSTRDVLLISGMLLASLRKPQLPQNLYEKIVCDTFMEFLANEDYSRWANCLYRELYAQSKVSGEKEWAMIEKQLFVHQPYHTSTAQRLWEGKKQAHLLSAR